ncbi:MAG: TonB family protein, partial [Woeseia sp.]
DKASEFDIANFIRLDEQSREVRSRRDPKAPQKPKQEQQETMRQLAQASGSNLSGMIVDLPDFDVDLGLDFGSEIQIARELMPLVRIPADYPRRALSEEIEGFVVMRFIVTETGSVADPEVLRSEPPGVFDSAAMRAVLRWKYQPQIRDGKPARVISITKINFEILEASEN